MLILSFAYIQQTSHPEKNAIDIQPFCKGNDQRIGTFRGKMRAAEMLHIQNIKNVTTMHGHTLISHTFWQCHIVSEQVNFMTFASLSYTVYLFTLWHSFILKFWNYIEDALLNRNVNSE
jgi:hypothetical protein